MSIASLGSLAIATAGLHLVQDIIGAMRAADADAKAANSSPTPSVAKSQPQVSTIVVHRDVYNGASNPNNSNAKRIANCSPCYQVYPHCHSIPLHTTPRLALQQSDTNSRSACEPTATTSSKSPIQAPWQISPWQEPAKQIVRVKVVQPRTDILTKGSLIDMFI